MSMLLAAEKIFVDGDEEITFISLKIASSKKENVLLIVPPNAQIFTNLITLKTLQRVAVNENKVLIIVSEDQYGGNLSQKAGLIFVNKVSQVTTDLWEVAREKLFSNQSRLNNIKDDNFHEASTEVTFEEKELLTEEIPIPIMHPTDISELDLESTEKESDVPESTESSKNWEYQKPEKKQNVVKIKGISLMVGGDIEASNKKSGENDGKMNNLVNFDDDNMEFKERQINKDVLGGGSFTGKDFTKATKSKSPGFFEKLFKGKAKSPEDRFQESEIDIKKKVTRRNRILAIAAIALGLFLIFIFMAVTQWSNVKFRIVLQKEEKLASQSVEADFKIESVDIVDFKVPGLKLETELASSSMTSDATGKGVKGIKSKGTIYVVNGTEQEIVLPANTAVTETKSGRQYVLPAGATIKAGSRASDNTIKSATTDKIPIEAAGFGEEFNLTTSQPYTFSISGLASGSTITVSLETGILGGTKTEFKSVEQANVDTLKDKILPTLKDKLKRDLKLQVPAGFILLEESVKFEDPKITAKPALGEEVTNTTGTFDLTVETKATGVIVKESDLKKLIEASIAAEQSSAAATINKIDKISVTNYVENTAGVFFMINAQSALTNSIDETKLKNQISGKSIESAEEAVSKFENVQAVEEVSYSPDIIPAFLRIIPQNKKNIVFEFK